MSALPFRVYDADNHYYESEEAFLRHLPAKFQKDFYFVEVKGRKKLVIGGMLSEYIPNPTFQVVGGPGVHVKWHRGQNPEGLSLREMTGKAVTQPPEWRIADERIALFDRQRVHAALMFPTLASVIEERLGAKGPTTAALFHSLNQWVHEEWGFARQDRLFAVPYISLVDVDAALVELDLALARGARAVTIRPAPVPHIAGSRSFGFPEYDRFWAKVAEAGIFACLHSSDTGYDKIYQWWAGGQDAEFLAFEYDAFKTTLDMVGRAASDSVAALICHGVFTRHPKLRVVVVEQGATWAQALLHRLTRAYGQMPRAFKEHPRDTFNRHFYVAPFYEDKPDTLREFIPVERMLFGSDFPHPEGVKEPLDYLDDFKSFKPDELEKIFSTNLKGLIEARPD
jgi:predicted TIM-barrel fold metal-dependent hydrolase